MPGRPAPETRPKMQLSFRATDELKRMDRSISSLLVAPDVADDVGNVLVTFFLVGNDG